MLSVSLQQDGFRRKADRLRSQLNPKTGGRIILRKIGRALRDAVKMRFTTQGGGSWAPLSPWTVARTGRRKALLPLRKRIYYRLADGGNKVEVYFDAPTSEWSIGQHQKGFRSPPVADKRMVVPLRAPASIGARGAFAAFSNRKASIIPARRVWLTQTETRAIVNEQLDAFAASLGAQQ